MGKHAGRLHALPSLPSVGHDFVALAQFPQHKWTP